MPRLIGRAYALTSVLVCLATLIASPVLAQAARDGRVQITVVDQTNAIVPGATVTLIGLEPATQSQTFPATTTSDKGVAMVERVPQGRYSVRAEFPGFDLGLLRDIRVRAGDNRHVVVLPLAKLEQSVTVGRDTQEVAADRRTSQFGNTVNEEQLTALSDDPAELQRQIQELAGPDAIIRVDSFEGQQLPPKAQIKSIHVVRDQFAAEASDPSSTFVDIVTQPGIGPIRGGMNFNFFDDVLAARSPLLASKGAEQSRTFGGNIGGALVDGRTSFSANLNGQSMYSTPSLNVSQATGITRFEVLNNRRTPREVLNVSGVLDHALTKDQTLKLSYNFNRQRLRNLGVGNYDLPERAFGGRQLNSQFRVQEAGPLGRRAFINTRLAFRQMDLDLTSETEAPTIVVLDAFNAGGAQQQQDTRLQGLGLASDIDYVRGVHSFRVGLQSDADWARNIQRTNYLGTYTFSSLAAYEAGQPLLFTRIVGDPRVAFLSVRNALYFQDDIKMKGLTLSPGVRYSQQNLVDDWSGWEPRFGLTWSPRANGTTTLRASAGLFHGFLPPQLYEQTLRVNGETQREFIIRNPSYPDPGTEGSLSSTNKYLLGDFNLQRNVRYAAGIDQVLSPRVRFNVLYNWIHLQQQPRGENLNPLVNGVRLDPNYGNVIAVVTDTEIRRHEVFVNSTISLAAPSPALQQARFNWRRLNAQAGYTFIGAQNNSAGAFTPPPTGSVEDDWGPGPQDAPYRFNIVATGTQLRNLTTVLTWIANSGQVYNETTGQDDNGDGIVNDRLPGVGLRSLRGEGQFQMNARLSYAFVLGGAAAPGAQPRYRLNVFTNIVNLTNHRNYAGYSGVIPSPFYRTPTMVINPRRVDIGMNLTF
jgi:hypothetical protein